ncbi:hypothetical protein ABZP36_035544 [Zizania latifolia]
MLHCYSSTAGRRLAKPSTLATPPFALSPRPQFPRAPLHTRAAAGVTESFPLSPAEDGGGGRNRGGESQGSYKSSPLSPQRAEAEAQAQDAAVVEKGE